MERHVGIGELNGIGSFQHFWRFKSFGEEDKLDGGAEVDYVKRQCCTACVEFTCTFVVSLSTFFLLASKVRRIVTHVLSLYIHAYMIYI